VSIAFPVEITGRDEAGEVFSEKTTTSAVSRYGCGIRLPRTVRPNEELRIRRLDNGDWEVGRVVARMNEHLTNVESDEHIFGVEMLKPCDEFWRIRFSSSDERLRDARLDGMYFVDRERRITHWSEGAVSIAGHAAADTVGKYCYNNILGHVDGKGMPLCAKGCPLASVMLDGKPREVQLYLMHKGGHYLKVAVRAQPVCNSAGRIVGAVEMFHTHVDDRPEAAAVRAGSRGGPPTARLAMAQIAAEEPR